MDSGVSPLPSTLALVPLAHFVGKRCTYSLTAQIVHHKCFCITESLRCLTHWDFTAYLWNAAKFHSASWQKSKIVLWYVQYRKSVMRKAILYAVFREQPSGARLYGKDVEAHHLWVRPINAGCSRYRANEIQLLLCESGWNHVNSSLVPLKA